MNKVILIGNIGTVPEKKEFNNGSIVKFSLATQKKYNGEEFTQWHNCQVGGKLQDIVMQYVNKGSKLMVEGEIKYSKYEKDGREIFVTNIQVFNIEMLGGKKDSNQQDNIPLTQAEEVVNSENGDDDLPF